MTNWKENRVLPWILSLAVTLSAMGSVVGAEFTVAQLPKIKEEKGIPLTAFLDQTVKLAGKSFSISDGAKAVADSIPIKQEDLEEIGTVPQEVFDTVVGGSGLVQFFDGLTVFYTAPAESLPVLIEFKQDRLSELRELLVDSRLSAEEFNRKIVDLNPADTGKIIVNGPPAFRGLVDTFANALKGVTAPPPTYRWEVRELKYTFADDTEFAGANDVKFTIPGVLKKLHMLVGFDDERTRAFVSLGTSPPGESASQPARLNALTGNQGARRSDLAAAQAIAVARDVAVTASRLTSESVVSQVEAGRAESRGSSRPAGQEVRSGASAEEAREEINRLLESNPDAVLRYFRMLSRPVQSSLILSLDVQAIDRLQSLLPKVARIELQDQLDRNQLDALADALELGVRHNPDSRVAVRDAESKLGTLVEMAVKEMSREGVQTPKKPKGSALADFEMLTKALASPDGPWKTEMNSGDLTVSVINAFQDLRADVQTDVLKRITEGRENQVKRILRAELERVFRERKQNADGAPVTGAAYRLIQGRYGSNSEATTDYPTAKAHLQNLLENPRSLGPDAHSDDVFDYYKNLSPAVQRQLIENLTPEKFAKIRALLTPKYRKILDDTERDIRKVMVRMTEDLEPLRVTDVKRTIFADKSRNAIVMFDTHDNIELYKRIIAELDVPTKLVEISVAIIDISTDRGIDWQSSILVGAAGQANHANISGIGGFNGNPKVVRDNLGSGNPPPALPFVPPAAGALAADLAESGGLNVSTLVVGSSHRVLTRIKALESRGDARILSRPMVMTMDNVQALFDEQLVLHIPVAGLENSELYKINAGIQVRVLPHVIEEDDGELRVRLAVHIEDGGEAEGNFEDIPALSKGTITTEAVIPENQSLMVGGRYRREEMRDEGRVPFIGRLPVIGLPFKSKTVTNRRFQRLFLITPKVIDPQLMHSSIADRAHEILEARPVRTGGRDGRPSQNDWNRENEALVFDAGNAADMPGEEKTRRRPILGFLKRRFHKNAKDH